MQSPPISCCSCMYRLQLSVFRSVMCRSCRQALQYRTVATNCKRKSLDSPTIGTAQCALAVLACPHGMIQHRCCHITRIPFHGPHRRPLRNCGESQNCHGALHGPGFRRDALLHSVRGGSQRAFRRFRPFHFALCRSLRWIKTCWPRAGLFLELAVGVEREHGAGTPMFRYRRRVLREVTGFRMQTCISKELFCQLPLWSKAHSLLATCHYEPQRMSSRPETCPPELRRWIFQAQTQPHSRPSLRLA